MESSDSSVRRSLSLRSGQARAGGASSAEKSVESEESEERGGAGTKDCLGAGRGGFMRFLGARVRIRQRSRDI